MSEMDAIRENATIDAWVDRFLRSKAQGNRPHETDAELIEIPEDPSRYLAVTIDTVSEEISEGIYKDPRTAGWVCAVASLSDLAAVGATPLGIVISVSLPDDPGGELAGGVSEGIEQACRSHGVHVLGGDTNATRETSLTACALGLVPRSEVLTRVGMSAGDAVFASGRVGAGNALGLARLAGMSDDAFPEEGYRPTAELAVGELLRGHASACMDTSDGVLATLDQLMRLNSLGFVVDCDWSRVLRPDVLEFCKATGTPEWLMIAGPHGEFRLVFTVPAPSMAAFHDAAEKAGMSPVSLGTVQPEESVSLSLVSGETVRVDVARLRNLLYEVGDDTRRLVTEFMAAGKEWGLQ
jgi:thiamine-monophosphate kinase